MIGVIPAAGAGQRIQPLGCSKELLPVGSRLIGGVERPKAVSEYLVERMLEAGATQICFVISPDKSDIMRYYADHRYPADFFYVVQPKPVGLCDSLFRAEPFARSHDQVLIGLPDTIWFPVAAYSHALQAPQAPVKLVLFPVENPSAFDAVECDEQERVREVIVKQPGVATHWVWGAVTTTGPAFHALWQLWNARERRDEYLGHLLNAFLQAGNVVRGCRVGEVYLDVGTMDGYRRGQDFLRSQAPASLSRVA